MFEIQRDDSNLVPKFIYWEETANFLFVANLEKGANEYSIQTYSPNLEAQIKFEKHNIAAFSARVLQKELLISLFDFVRNSLFEYTDKIET